MSQREPTGTLTADPNGAPHDTRPNGVPAVANAIAILGYLEENGNRPATMSDIARACHMNVSTCFNILRTLREARYVGYDPETRRYDIGMAIADLALQVNVHRQVVSLAMEQARALAEQVQMACMVVRRLESGEFLVVDVVDSNRPIRVTVSAGERFDANAGIYAKAWYAWCPDADFDRMVAEHGLPRRTAHSITDVLQFRDELRLVRQRGYATGFSEYYLESSAVAAAIFDTESRVSHLMVVTAFTSQLTEERAHQVGRQVYHAARSVTRRVGGADPPLQPA
jgi:DNA-binding IclR family transcriptional regulator